MDTVDALMASMEITVIKLMMPAITTIISITDTPPLTLTTTMDTLETIITTEAILAIVIQPAMVAQVPMPQTVQAVAPMPIHT